jgi:hypothetical protein
VYVADYFSLGCCLIYSVNSIKPLEETPKWGLDKRGLGNPSFLQKSLKNIAKQQKIDEKSYKIDAKTTTQGGGAKRRPLGAPPKAAPVVFCIYVGMIFQLFLAVLLCFAMISAEKIGFPGPFCPGPIWGLPN